MSRISAFIAIFLCGLLPHSFSQTDSDSLLTASTLSGLKWRSIGPAFTSGRIADIAIHPEDENVWYVAVGSGGVWKTENAGTTWNSIFDGQASYSIGCVTIDPLNPHTIWVGTGENVGGRHVGYGDGIYQSTDDGKTWTNKGLKETEHISKIIIHPEDPNTIWVAAQGPLWSQGGERGLYKSSDGGETWNRTLGDDAWVGVTDVVIDPQDPNWLYAATWQRHRTVAAYLGGGPGTGLHRSTDGGETWQELTQGIPKGNLGKIGLAISPHNPDVLYAAIEEERLKGGVYISTNRGMSWSKQSSTVSGGTGPHYYQELFASPHAEGRLYLMDVRIQVSDDHGKTFRRLSEEDKHSDNHAIAFRKDDPDYLLVGSDGGLYESMDLAQSWRFIHNMPITQYYKVAVDDAEPFYFVYGGTQDNGSHGGPSQTDNQHGIRNADWFKTLFADGHQSATEPGNPNIMYAETQQGGLHRIDRITGEQVYIQPQSGEGEPYERYNWDAPIVVSTNNPATIYFASQRVWKSTDRGDSWTAISSDLTRNQERIALPIMGRVQSWDNAWDVGAMSNYNTIASLGISMINEQVIYAGTDDGLIQVTEDGGLNWRKIEVGEMPGVPATAFVNDIRPDLYDEGTVYVALDNHKYGDFNPYLMKSTDHGRSWQSIAGNLPDRTLVWRTVQDHVKADLLFAATEFGVYVTLNGGAQWTHLKGEFPTISVRDITIQRREDDLVAATFGRSFYILDDYSALREISETQLTAEATLFPVKDAWWYRPRTVVSSQGSAQYVAENPPFGAAFTYHLSEGLTTLAKERKEREKELAKTDADVPFPGWEALEEERIQEEPKILLTIRDNSGTIVNNVEGKTSKGFHRVNWDLRHASKNGIRMQQSEQSGFGFFGRGGFMATPGEYTVTLSKVVDGQMTELAGPQSFRLEPLRKGALEGASHQEIAAFRSILEEFQQDITATTTVLDNSLDKVRAMQVALGRLDGDQKALVAEIYEVKRQLLEIEQRLSGDDTKDEIGERSDPTPRNRMFVGFRALNTTYGPTAMHKESVDLGTKELSVIKQDLSTITEELLPQLEKKLMDSGAPWMEGQGLIGK